MSKGREKILVIRFSSFGDIVQSMGCVDNLKKRFPESTIAWLTKTDFERLVSIHPSVDEVITFDKSDGLMGLIALAFRLRNFDYDLIYDAHSNLRSMIVRTILKFRKRVQIVRRKKERLKRILLFTFKKNHFPWPYLGMKSYLAPLSDSGVETSISVTDLDQWVISDLYRSKIDFCPSDYIVLAPSAAWPMKRWPVNHWKKLIKLLPNRKFVIVGGPGDDFCEELTKGEGDRIINAAGKLSWEETISLVRFSNAVISADTGVMHLGDLLGIPTMALIGPTAFGFPSRKTSRVFEVELPCRPCTKDGRGKCSQAIYQKCMVEITPQDIVDYVYQLGL